METQVTFSGSPSTGMSFLMIVPLMVSSTKTFPQSMKARSLIRFTSTWHPEGYSGDMESPETVIAKSTSRIGDNTFSQSYSITDAVKSFNDPPCADIGINGTMVADSSCSQDSPPKYLCGFREGAFLISLQVHESMSPWLPESLFRIPNSELFADERPTLLQVLLASSLAFREPREHRPS